MTRIRILPILCVCVVCALSGCAKQPDQRVDFDRQVRDGLAKYKRVNAVEFFENGGHFWNVGAEGESRVDEECVLPLVKALSSEASIRSEVLVSSKDEGFAVSLLVPVPVDDGTKVQMESLIAKADEAFPGAILQQQGNDWLSLAFLDTEEVDLIKLRAPKALEGETFKTSMQPRSP